MTSRPSKAQRQHRVAKLLEDHQVTSQPQLVELLAGAGVVVNQATVSRDLDELGAIKVRVPGGETAYAVPELPARQQIPSDHLRRVMGDWVVELARSGDIVILRTPPGSAHVVASAIDRSDESNIVGTVAGDDTIMVVASERGGPKLAARFAQLAGLE